MDFNRLDVSATDVFNWMIKISIFIEFVYTFLNILVSSCYFEIKLKILFFQKKPIYFNLVQIDWSDNFL